MIKRHNSNKAAGFTLIDAMIAVVVLATGILALTVLQTRMMRATTEARDRSEATVTAQNVLERLRADATQTSAGYTGLVSQGLNSGACDLSSNSAVKLANQIGATSAADFYRYCVRVTRFWACPSGQFTNNAATCAAPSASGFTAEYKQVELTLGWRDAEASGAAASDWHTVTLGDAVSGIPLVNSTELQIRDLEEKSTLGGAQVRYPGTFFADEHNFIPIAVGNNGTGSRIAATNPTPKVTGGGIGETSFQIYTYLAQTGAIQVQRQVDTKAVACSCSLQAAPSSPTVMDDVDLRPSYWDGRRYTVPTNIKNQGNYLRGVHTGGSTESEYCDVCCRDHHDPATFDYDGDDNADPSDDRPKYDPYTAHDHWLNGTKAVGAGDAYKEVCRVVRVDGVYRVTPDPAMEHFAFLPTDSDATAPTTDRMAESPSFRYNTFVRDFVKERLNLAAALSGYAANGFLDTTAVAGLENNSAVLLNQQAGSEILISSNDVNSPTGGPARYLQDRVIVMDALEFNARKTIQDAINDPLKPGCATDPLPCALPYVPFASVNLTPLTLWNTQWVKDGETLTPARTLSQASLSVSPQDVLSGQTVQVYAGQVGLNSAKIPAARDDDTMLATISRTVTALVERFVLFPTPTQADANAWKMTDAQPFRVTSSPSQGLVFQVRPTGLSYLTANHFNNNDAPFVKWVPVSGTGGGTCNFDSTNKVYNCYVSSSYVSGGMSVALQVQITRYHQIETVKQQDKVTCTAPPGFNKDVDTQYPAKCTIWSGASAMVGSTGVTVTQTTTTSRWDNPTDDMITVAAGQVANNQVVTVGFTKSMEGLFPERNSPVCNAATGIAQNWTFTTCR